jgi:hypothetical protein
MTTDAAEQMATSARRPGVCVGVPVLASTITVLGVPEWAVPRLRATTLIAEGTRWCPRTVVTGPPVISMGIHPGPDHFVRGADRWGQRLERPGR